MNLNVEVIITHNEHLRGLTHFDGFERAAGGRLLVLSLKKVSFVTATGADTAAATLDQLRPHESAALLRPELVTMHGGRWRLLLLVLRRLDRRGRRVQGDLRPHGGGVAAVGRVPLTLMHHIVVLTPQSEVVQQHGRSRRQRVWSRHGAGSAQWR